MSVPVTASARVGARAAVTAHHRRGDGTAGPYSVSVQQAGHQGVARTTLPVKAVGGPFPLPSLPVVARKFRCSWACKHIPLWRLGLPYLLLGDTVHNSGHCPTQPIPAFFFRTPLEFPHVATQPRVPQAHGRRTLPLGSRTNPSRSDPLPSTKPTCNYHGAPRAVSLPSPAAAGRCKARRPWGWTRWASQFVPSCLRSARPAGLSLRGTVVGRAASGRGARLWNAGLPSGDPALCHASHERAFPHGWTEGML